MIDLGQKKIGQDHNKDNIIINKIISMNNLMIFSMPFLEEYQCRVEEEMCTRIVLII